MSAAKDFIKKLDLSKLDEVTAQHIRDFFKSEEFKAIELSDDMEEFQKVKEMIESEFPEALGLKKKPVPTHKIEPTVSIEKDEDVEVDDEDVIAKIEAEIKDMDEQLFVVRDLLEDDKNDIDLKDQLEVLTDLIADSKAELIEAKKLAKKKVSKKELGGFLLGAGLGFIGGNLIKIKLPEEPKVVYLGKKKYEDGGELHHINLSWVELLPLLISAYKEKPTEITDEFMLMAKAADELYAHSISDTEDKFFQNNIIKYVIKVSNNSNSDYEVLENIAEMADKYNDAVDNPSLFDEKYTPKFLLVAQQRKVFEYDKGGILGKETIGTTGSDFKVNLYKLNAIDRGRDARPDITIYDDKEEAIVNASESYFSKGWMEAQLFEKKKGKYRNFSTWANTEKGVMKSGGGVGGSTETGDNFRLGGNVSSSDIDNILKHYVMAALWSTSNLDDDDSMLDEQYSFYDVDEKTIESMKSDIKKFISENEKDIAASGMNEEQLGHDLWLSRNGHGAGFFDRNYDSAVADRLQDSARKMKGTDLYVGDDGKIHSSGEGVYRNGGLVSGDSVAVHDVGTIKSMKQGKFLRYEGDYDAVVDIKGKEHKVKEYNVVKFKEGGEVEDSKKKRIEEIIQFTKSNLKGAYNNLEKFSDLISNKFGGETLGVGGGFYVSLIRMDDDSVLGVNNEYVLLYTVKEGKEMSAQDIFEDDNAINNAEVFADFVNVHGEELEEENELGKGGDVDEFDYKKLIGYTMMGKHELSTIVSIDRIRNGYNYKVKRDYITGNMSIISVFALRDLRDLYNGKKVGGYEAFMSDKKDGGTLEYHSPNPTRINDMVESFKTDGRAFSNVNNDDSEFFDAVGISMEDVGITSQTGGDILYYDVNVYENDTNAIKGIKQ